MRKTNCFRIRCKRSTVVLVHMAWSAAQPVISAKFNAASA